MSIGDESGIITLKLTNAETGQTIVKEFNENTVTADIYNTLYEIGFLSLDSDDYSWFCDYDQVNSNMKTIKSCGLHSGDELMFHNEKKISITIKGPYGSEDYDIDVPVDATIGDVIIGLISAGILKAETDGVRNYLCLSGNAKEISRNKTIGECGWKIGQYVFANCSESHG